MGTRSKTNVLDKDRNVIISIYRQNDGDFQHHGKDLFTFFTKSAIAKKISIAVICPEYNGGMEDMAGKLFCFLCTKTKEIMPAPDCTNNDFAYEYEIGFITRRGLYAKGRNMTGSEAGEWFPITDETFRLTKKA